MLKCFVQVHTHAVCFPNALRWYGSLATPGANFVATLDQTLVEVVGRKDGRTVEARLSLIVDEADVVDGAYLRVVQARYVLHALGLGDVAHKERVETVFGRQESVHLVSIAMKKGSRSSSSSRRRRSTATTKRKRTLFTTSVLLVCFDSFRFFC